MDANPAFHPLLLVCAWVFFWEIGGQNVPSDWNDTEEDKRVNAKTIPLQLGRRKAGFIILLALGLTVTLSLFLPQVSPLSLGQMFSFASAAVGVFLLLKPAYELNTQKEGRLAAKLFDNASYYPLVHLVIISVFVMFR
jgi:4-hydroxybenzoate polyprenyltransferase